jgi:D-tyrosyl-tRNA(Tyr) deacylase
MALISTRKPLLGNVVKHEYAREHGYCREVVTVNVAAATELSNGSVLGKVTATGKYVPRDPAAVDGSEVAAAVVVANTDVAAATDTEVAVLVRGPAIIAKQALVFDVAHDAGQIETAVAEIESLGVVVREQV